MSGDCGEKIADHEFAPIHWPADALPSLIDRRLTVEKYPRKLLIPGQDCGQQRSISATDIHDSVMS